MLYKRILSLVVITLLTVGVLTAQPQPGPQMPPPGAPMLKALNLTDEQRDQIADFRLELQKKMVAMRGDLQKLQSEYRLMLIDDKVSEKELQKQLQKIGDLRIKMALERAKNQRKIRSLLTDVQKKKFDAMILAGPKGRMKARMMKRHSERAPRQSPRMGF
ncbi:MAG: Spy/CpxP family protein refolding chaperone [Calditrichaeota bacterium]|nr:Spy/CpxP family protein refolding chaperone [Calditrichota bacterium]